MTHNSRHRINGRTQRTQEEEEPRDNLHESNAIPHSVLKRESVSNGMATEQERKSKIEIGGGGVCLPEITMLAHSCH